MEATGKKGGLRLQTRTERDRYCYYLKLFFLLLLLALNIDFCSGLWNFAEAISNGSIETKGEKVSNQVLMKKSIASTYATSNVKRFFFLDIYDAELNNPEVEPNCFLARLETSPTWTTYSMVPGSRSVTKSRLLRLPVMRQTRRMISRPWTLQL